MLAQNRRIGSQEDLQPIQAEPLRVELPPELKAFFQQHGYQKETAANVRSDARLQVRTEVEFAFHSHPPALDVLLQKLPQRATGLIKDLSRTGIALLYHKQLYPAQELQVFLLGRELFVKVVRCRKLSDCCYEVGGRVLKTVRYENEISQ